MPQAWRELEREYLDALIAFLESATEENLERAYGVARKAMASGLGVLDLASIFRKALREVLANIPASALTEQIVEGSMSFFRESLSPFEMTLRGFLEHHDRLQNNCRQLANAQTRLRYQNQELTMARQRYSEQLEFTPDGCLVTDLTGTIEEANAAASLLFRVDPDQLVGDSLSMYLEAGSPQVFKAHLSKLQRGSVERLNNWQTTITPEQGTPFPAALTAGVIRDPAGRPSAVRWLIRDMTQLQRAEEAASELANRERSARQETDAARKLAFLAEASAILGASLDCEVTLPKIAELAVPFLSDWCLVYLVDDASALRQVALAPASHAATEMAATVAEATSEWIQSVISGWKVEGAAEIQRSLTRRADETAERPTVTGAVLVLPLVARGRVFGAIALVSGQPDTPIHEIDRGLLVDFAKRCSSAVDNAMLHREVIAQRDNAEKSSQVKDEFLAMLSHELRNPLVPILGWTRILKTRRDTSEEVFAEGVRSLERNASNIKRLVDDCLELMRTSTGRIRIDLQRTDLNAIAAISVEAVMPLAREKDLKLDIDLSSGPLWVLGDRMRLEQVMVNLLTNAIKYTPSGSIEIRSTKSQGQAELQIADTGIGIAPDLLGKIFEPFTQATTEWLTSHSGLGIGLSIAREIVRLHSGWIWAESPGPRKGSTFSLALPLLAAEAYASLPPINDATVHYRPARPCRVLLVEDSDDVLYLMKRELEWTGHKVYPAMDGMTALEIARRELPDIIISDIKMPRLDGYQFIQQIRALPKLASVPAIAMTGFGMERDAELARSAGYSAHMVKPVDPNEMEQLIQSLTERSISHARLDSL